MNAEEIRQMILETYLFMMSIGIVPVIVLGWLLTKNKTLNRFTQVTLTLLLVGTICAVIHISLSTYSDYSTLELQTMESKVVSIRFSGDSKKAYFETGHTWGLSEYPFIEGRTYRVTFTARMKLITEVEQIFPEQNEGSGLRLP